MINYNDINSTLKFDKLGSLTVGSSSVLSNAIDISKHNAVEISFVIETLVGTYVKIEKILASETGAFAGEEVVFNNPIDFLPSDSSKVTLIDALAQCNLTTADVIKKIGLKATIVQKYKYLKLAFLSDANNNKIVFTVVLGNGKNQPENQ